MKKAIVINRLETYKGKIPEITHSDRGNQYTSYAYQEILESHHIQHSMSAPGIPTDNDVIESFHKTIKRELIYPNRHKTKVEMKVLITNYLNQYYVYERIHTKFMMTPHLWEMQLPNVT